MTQPIGIIVNGATGRMGYRQHLVRSLVPIRDAGGVLMADGSRQPIELILVGRRPERLREIADELRVDEISTDLDAVLGDPRWQIYFDAGATNLRAANLRKAIAAGKSIYTEKPIADSLTESIEIAELAAASGIRTGVVHDKLFLPGLLKLRRLIDSGFFGRILSVRGEFGYWVWEGDWQSAQRPSWNYRKEDGGSIVVDMFPHWCYVIENLFGEIDAVTAKVVTHIPTRWDEQGAEYPATADDAAYAFFEVGDIVVAMNSSWTTRVNRKELVEFHIDGTHGSAVAGLFGCKIQPRELTPKPVWNPDLPDEHDYFADWHEIPNNAEFQNGFKAQWEEFLRAEILGEDYKFDLADGARGVRLAEAGLLSNVEGRRVQLSELD